MILPRSVDQDVHVQVQVHMLCVGVQDDHLASFLSVKQTDWARAVKLHKVGTARGPGKGICFGDLVKVRNVLGSWEDWNFWNTPP